MKTMHFRIGLSLLLAIGLSFSVFAQDFRAALVDFMYVPEGMDGQYVQMEQEIAKPVHQEMINQGHLDGWYLFAIPFPGGTNAEYHYATVRIYSNPEQMESPNNFGAVMEKVHAGKEMDKVVETVLATRDLVKTHRLFSWERFAAEDLQGPPPIIQVVYFKVPFGKQADYQKMEREIFHPMHKKEIELGKRAAWEGWSLQSPWGSSQPYSHIAVDMYKDWAQYTSPGVEDLLQQVHPGKTQEELNKMFTATADLVNMEEWRLIDYVAKE